MPRGDKKGPQGQGPKTGRGRGRCNPKGVSTVPLGPDDMGSDRRGGQGRSQGAGQGSGRNAGRGQGKGRSAGQGRGQQS